MELSEEGSMVNCIEKGIIMTVPDAPQQQYPQYPQQQYPQQQYPQPVPSNGMGITGFVTGLLGLLFFWVPFFGLILGILGVVFGGVGFQASRKRGRSNGMAIAGLVLGTITIVIAIIFLIAVIGAS